LFIRECPVKKQEGEGEGEGEEDRTLFYYRKDTCRTASVKEVPIAYLRLPTLPVSDGNHHDDCRVMSKRSLF